MTSELTPWFVNGEKPAYVGVYRSNASGLTDCYQHWDGRVWGVWCDSVERAYKSRTIQSFVQSPHWRGLAQNPEGKHE